VVAYVWLGNQLGLVASWIYLGSGYQSTGEAWLAASAAARAREERRVAREELRSTTAAA
jgi:hypothetical protein